MEVITDARLHELVERVEQALAAQESGDAWLDVEGAANYLSTTKDAIRGHVRRREIPHHRRGTRLLFSARELDRWIRDGSAAAA
jgi:excisionase family DNA binding protein